MSAEPPNTPKKLRWWFWLVLFAPAVLFSLVAPKSPLNKMHLQGSEVWITNVLWTFFGSLNLVCSLAAAALIERARTGSATLWSVLVAALFFFMNIVLAFAGCAGMANLYR